MSLTFIRHAEKKHENGCRTAPYPFDPGLVGDPFEKIQQTVQTLVEEEGPPDLMIVSPLLRTRQTAMLIQKVLTELGDECVAIADPNLGEYLGNWFYIIKPDQMEPETRGYKPVIDSNIKEFKARVLKAFKDLQTNYIGKKIWVITHGLVIKTCSQEMGLKIRNLPELGAVQVQGEKVWIRQGKYWISN